MSRSQKLLFLLAFSILLVGRLWIAGRGYLDDSDEWLYLWIHGHWAEFWQPATWGACMKHMQAQPPDIAIRLIQYLTILPLSQLSGHQMLHQQNLYYVGLYNIIASLLGVFVFFRILRRLDVSYELATAGMFMLGALLNYNIYTRHLLPYDYALLFHLLSLYILLHPSLSRRRVMAAGLLSALGLTTYIGSFILVGICGSYLMTRQATGLRERIARGVLFALPFVLLYSIYEALAHANGQSYFQAIGTYYDGVYTEASLDEGLIYAGLYFYLVERLWGVLILLFFMAGVALLYRQPGRRDTKILLSLGIAAYLVYGSLVYFFHQLPFHGRILHYYYPFIILGVVVAASCIRVRGTYVALALILFATVNYGYVLHGLNDIVYPRQVIYEQHLFARPDTVHLSHYEEIPHSLDYTDRASWYIDSVGPARLPSGEYLLVNVAFLRHYPDDFIKEYSPYHMAAGDSLIYEGTHFQSHPAYTLEYCTRQARQFFTTEKVKIRVIRKATH